jgi:hypothetical protein
MQAESAGEHSTKQHVVLRETKNQEVRENFIMSIFIILVTK